MFSVYYHTRLITLAALVGALFVQPLPTGAFAANDAAIKSRAPVSAQTQAVTFPAKKIAVTGAQKRAISAVNKKLDSGKLLITASAWKLVTSRQLTFELPNRRIVVTPQGRKTYAHKRVPVSMEETLPPALVLTVFPKALQMKIAKEFRVKNVNLDDYEFILILDSADENDIGRLVGDGIAKTYGKDAIRAGKDGKLYLDVSDDDLRELFSYIQFKIRIKRKSDGKFVENPQFVVRNPLKSEPPPPKPPVSPPL